MLHRHERVYRIAPALPPRNSARILSGRHERLDDVRGRVRITRARRGAELRRPLIRERSVAFCCAWRYFTAASKDLERRATRAAILRSLESLDGNGGRIRIGSPGPANPHPPEESAVGALEEREAARRLHARTKAIIAND